MDNKVIFMKRKSILFLTILTASSFNLFSCNQIEENPIGSSIKETTDSTSTSAYPSSKQGESYTSFDSIDYLGNIDLPYFENEGDIQTKRVGGLHEIDILSIKYIYYKSSDTIKKCRDLVKNSDYYLVTKTNSKSKIANGITEGNEEKEVVYKDGYYYLINYLTRFDEYMTKYEGAYEYETTVSMPYISFDYINTKNNKNFSGGFPFVCRIKNDDKLKTGDIKKLSYTYDELNEKI